MFKTRTKVVGRAFREADKHSLYSLQTTSSVELFFGYAGITTSSYLILCFTESFTDYSRFFYYTDSIVQGIREKAV